MLLLFVCVCVHIETDTMSEDKDRESAPVVGQDKTSSKICYYYLCVCVHIDLKRRSCPRKRKHNLFDDLSKNYFISGKRSCRKA